MPGLILIVTATGMIKANRSLQASLLGLDLILCAFPFPTMLFLGRVLRAFVSAARAVSLLEAPLLTVKSRIILSPLAAASLIATPKLIAGPISGLPSPG